MAADSPEQVAGVLAHEIGHITGGHLARLSGALNNARRQARLRSYWLRLRSALRKKAVLRQQQLQKSSEIATKGVFKFSRTQERSADQFAVELLEKTQTSANGLLEFLNHFRIRNSRPGPPRHLCSNPSAHSRPDRICSQAYRKVALLRKLYASKCKGYA